MSKVVVMAGGGCALCNAHVLLYYRWQHWVARQAGHYLAMSVWAALHNRELRT